MSSNNNNLHSFLFGSFNAIKYNHAGGRENTRTIQRQQASNLKKIKTSP